MKNIESKWIVSVLFKRKRIYNLIRTSMEKRKGDWGERGDTEPAMLINYFVCLT